MTYSDWLQKAKNNTAYIRKDSIVLDINQTSEEIYNRVADTAPPEQAGICNSNGTYTALIRRDKSDTKSPYAFLRCNDGIYLALSSTDLEKLLSKSICQLNINLFREVFH